MTITEVNYLASVDKVCDYIPIVSTITNIVELFIKCVVLPFLSQETIQDSHFYTHLQEKSFARCALLLVPILGNIVIGILDCQSQDETPDISSLSDFQNQDDARELPLPLRSLEEWAEIKRNYDRDHPSREQRKWQRETGEGPHIYALRNYVPQPVNPENERLQEQLLHDAKQFLIELVHEQGIIEIMMGYAGHRLSEIEKAAIARVNENGDLFYYESDEMKGNFSVVEAAMNKDGRLLRLASQEMQGNFEIVKIAVEKNGLALQYASPEMKGNFEIVKIAVEQNSSALQHASPEMKGNADIVLAAVKKFGPSLGSASPEMKDNFDIVLAAVKQCGHALSSAGPTMNQNLAIVTAALEQRAFEPHMKQCVTTSQEFAHFHLRKFIKEPLRNDNEVIETLYQRLLTLYAEADLINNAG